MGRKSRYQLAVIQDQTMILNGGISKWDFCSVHFWWSNFLRRRSACAATESHTKPCVSTLEPVDSILVTKIQKICQSTASKPNHQTWNKQTTPNTQQIIMANCQHKDRCLAVLLQHTILISPLFLK